MFGAPNGHHAIAYVLVFISFLETFLIINYKI